MGKSLSRFILFVLGCLFLTQCVLHSANAQTCHGIFHLQVNPAPIRGTPEMLIPHELKHDGIEFPYDPTLYMPPQLIAHWRKFRFERLEQSRTHAKLLRAGQDLIIRGRLSTQTLKHILEGDFERFDLYGSGKEVPLLNGGLHSTEGLKAFLSERRDIISHEWVFPLIRRPQDKLKVGGVWYELPLYSNGVRVVQLPVIAFNRNGRRSTKAPFNFGQTFAPGTKTLFPNFFTKKEVAAAIAAVIQQNPNPQSRLITGTYQTFNLSGRFALSSLEGVEPTLAHFFKLDSRTGLYTYFLREVPIEVRVIVGLNDAGEVVTAYPDQIQPGFGEPELFHLGGSPMTLIRERVMPRAGLPEQEFRRLIHFQPTIGIFPVKEPNSRITPEEQFESLRLQQERLEGRS